jgi:hypothetical protein
VDNLDRVWKRFSEERTADLFERFPGFYRAVVVETNDALQFHRVRFKCPELHDSTLKTEECPWAVVAPWLGGQNAGSWASPIIGDIVWITFEKNHPYGPICVGFADPTRRKFYPLHSIYTESPMAVKLDGTSDEIPDDYLEEYLPLDRRPMSHGSQDRYGHSNVTSSVGFFPIEHINEPAPLGVDAISKKKFEVGKKPKVNEPDRKYTVKTTKYGNYEIMSDVGYWWQRKDPKKDEEDDEFGEFRGDFKKDREFEIKRYKYLTKLYNEDQPTDSDQRRWEIRTRAGHKIEMRDVGWAQKGGGRNGCEEVQDAKCRENEYGEARILSKNENTDERWIKFRSKGGHLFQAMDIGFHPEEDEYYGRILLDEVGVQSDKEYDHDWTSRDARQIRIVTRWGNKLVLDDRGTHTKKADTEELPRGNGWMLRSRRSWQKKGDNPRGFAIEANDKDELNTTRWYTPKSKIIEMNDNKDYVMMCTDVKGDIAREWKGLAENEFALRVALTEEPEKDTYHLKLDKFNGYLRLKTAAGKDDDRKPEPEAFASAEKGLNQGIEARDGRFGSDGAWAEVVDIEHRGMWWSKNEQMGIWRAKEDSEQYIVIHDGKKQIIIRNNENGPIQIYCKDDVQIIADGNIAMKAGKKITFKAGQEVAFEAGSAGHAKLLPGGWYQDVPDNAPEHRGRLPGAEPGGGAQSPSGQSATVINPTVLTQDKREPEDRGESLNTAPEVPEKIVRVCE